METVKFIANRRLRNVSIGLVTLAVLATLLALAGTETGKRILAPTGINDSIAKTIGAADRAVVRTSDALQFFIGRSPGERGATDVLKGKATRKPAQTAIARSGPKQPTQRALGKIFDKPLDSLVGAVTPQPFLEILPVDSVMGTEPALALTSPPPISSAIFSPVIGGGIIGGNFGGGGGGGPSGPIGGPISPPATPTVVSAVPEPSTWLLLLIGFGAIGASTRRAKTLRFSGSGRAGNCAAN